MRVWKLGVDCDHSYTRLDLRMVCGSRAALILLVYLSCTVQVHTQRRNDPTPVVVVLPPGLISDKSNLISVVATENAEVRVKVNDGSRLLQYVPISVSAGKPTNITIGPFTATPPSYLLRVDVVSAVRGLVYSNIFHLPRITDVAEVHLETEKDFYRPMETVRFRVLPLTPDYHVSTSPFTVVIQNPDELVVWKETLAASSDKPFVKSAFQLPQHLAEGRWKILVRDASIATRTPLSEKQFEVMRYELPKFEVLAVANISYYVTGREAIGVLVFARLATGRPVSGTLVLLCSSPLQPSITVRTTQIQGGNVSIFFSLQRCWPPSSGNAPNEISIRAEVRDYGSGEKHFTTLKIPFQAKPYTIKVLPLKPGLTIGRINANLSVPFLVSVLQATGRPAERIPVQATVECIQQRNRIDYVHTSKTFGSTNENGDLLINLQLRQKCLTLMIQVSTNDLKLRESQQSSTRLLLPSFITDAAAIFGVDKFQFQVGQTLPIRILRSAYSAAGTTMRIVAISQSNIVAHLPVTTDFVQLQVISGMLPEFVLILYHTSTDSSTAVVDDVIRIFVSYGCARDRTVLKIVDQEQPSANHFQPGSKATLIMEANQGAFVATKAADKKLEQLARQFQLFEQPGVGLRRTGDVLEKLFESNKTMDGFDFAVRKSIALGACCSAGRIWWQNKTDVNCANLNARLSYLEDCHSEFVKCCSQTEFPTPEKACQDGQTSCRSIVFAGAGINTRMHSPKSPLFAAAPPVLEEEEPDDRTAVLRGHFPEVWLFEEFSLGVHSALAAPVSLPHSVTNWTVTGRFWTPSTPVCQVQTEIGIEMSAYMEIDLPSVVYVGDQILTKVIIYNFEASQKKVEFSVKKPGGLCTSSETRDRHLTLNASSTAVVTMPFEFMRSDRYEIVFTLTEYQGHSRPKQLDQVAKEVYVMAREIIDSSLEYNFSWDLGAGDSVDKWINDTILAYNFVRFKEEDSAEINASIYLTDAAISNIRINKMIAQFTPLPAAKRARWSKLRLANDTWRDFVTASSLNEVLVRAPSVLQAVEDSKDIDQAIPNKVLVQANQLLHLCQMETLSFRAPNGAYSPFRIKESVPEDVIPVSVWLTVLTTALHCRTNMDVSVVCPSLRWLTEQQNVDGSFTSSDSRDFTTLTNESDNRVILTSSALLTLRVCANYGNKCGDYWVDENQKRLMVRKALGFLPNVDTKKADPLVLGSLALAFAVWKHPFARPENDALLKLLEEGSDYPYWTYRRQTNGWWAKVKHGAKGWFSAEYRNKMLSCQIALNAMGLMTQLMLGNPKRLNLEQIGLWLIEHRKRDGIFIRTLDTLLASRALSELQRSLVERDSNVVTRISVQCEHAADCPSISITPQNAELTQTLRLNMDSRGLTFLVTGRGAVYVKFQLIGSPPLRNSNYYPVQLSANTSADGSNSFLHDLCFRSSDEAITSFVIEHSFGSGLSFLPGTFNLTKGTLTVHPAEPTSHSVNILFSDLRKETEYCYTFQTTRSQANSMFSLRRPILAKHASLGVVGATLSSGQNQGSQVPLLEKYCPENSDECICAEAACPPPQAECSSSMCNSWHVRNLLKALCDANNTGCVVKLTGQEEENTGMAVYRRYITSKHFALFPNSSDDDCKNLDVLIRKTCTCPQFLRNDYYVLVVRRDALQELSGKGFRPTVLVGEHGFFEPYFACSDNRQSDIHKLVQENHRRKICANLT